MLTYDYVDKGARLDNHLHRGFEVKEHGVVVAGGVDITKPNGDIVIRVHGYRPVHEPDIRSLFNVTGVKEISFSNPL